VEKNLPAFIQAAQVTLRDLAEVQNRSRALGANLEHYALAAQFRVSYESAIIEALRQAEEIEAASRATIDSHATSEL